MPKIEISTCNLTPNFDALEAVARAMRDNYVQRDYRREQVVVVSTGRKLKVLELDADTTDSPCNCKYEVQLVPNAKVRGAP